LEYVRSDLAVTATTKATAHRSKLIGKKHVVIEAHADNKKKVYVGASYEYTGVLSTEYDTLQPKQVKFYSAPKGQTIQYLWYYSESGTQYINIIASDGSMTRFGDMSLEKDFHYDFIKGQLIEPSDAEAAKSDIFTPSDTEEVLFRGVEVSESVFSDLDRIDINILDASSAVHNRVINTFYFTCINSQHLIMLEKPVVLPANYKLNAYWWGTAGASRKIYIRYYLKKKSATTA